MQDALRTQAHRRYNALSGDWILVSPFRTQRPWQGKLEKPDEAARPAYDPACYLCPGNRRAGDSLNPPYAETFVFTNDFAAIRPEPPTPILAEQVLFQAQTVSGTCRVICFSPRHDLTLAKMEPAQIRVVIDLWASQIEDLGRAYRWVQIFENKGALMGCSNPHPHGQIWASDALPNEPAKENAQQRAYWTKNATPLLVDYGAMEAQAGERLVVENEDWRVVTPWWAVWPFETLLLPKRHVLRLPDLTDRERDGLAQILKSLLVRYDNLFEVSFPYSMGWHGAPEGEAALGEEQSHWQLHAHFCPPLLRSASVRKFLVGYELLAEAQRDLTPEQAAESLREMRNDECGIMSDE